MSIAVGGDDGKTARFIEGGCGAVVARTESGLRAYFGAGDDDRERGGAVGAVRGDTKNCWPMLSCGYGSQEQLGGLGDALASKGPDSVTVNGFQGRVPLLCSAGV